MVGISDERPTMRRVDSDNRHRTCDLDGSAPPGPGSGGRAIVPRLPRGDHSRQPESSAGSDVLPRGYARGGNHHGPEERLLFARGVRVKGNVQAEQRAARECRSLLPDQRRGRGRAGSGERRGSRTAGSARASSTSSRTASFGRCGTTSRARSRCSATWRRPDLPKRRGRQPAVQGEPARAAGRRKRRRRGEGDQCAGF